MKVLGVNAVFHDPAAALVIDGQIVAAAEEERFNRRKHGKVCVPFSTWELPEAAIAWCLKQAGVRPDELDGVAYSYDPSLCPAVVSDMRFNGRKGVADPYVRDGWDAWEPMRTMYTQRAAEFVGDLLPGFDHTKFVHVAHHVAHAASAFLGSGYDDCAVLVMDGRGEASSHLAGVV